MKYRIITDGTQFRIQRRVCFGWLTVKDGPWHRLERASRPFEFNTEDLAVEFVKRKYGLSSERVREWRTV